MKFPRHALSCCAAPLAALLLLAASPSAFGKPEWAGNGNGKHKGKSEKHERRGAAAVPTGGFFGGAQRDAVRAYYEPRMKAGKCPPGLAKKNNGCLPPGQAKNWQRGQQLPKTVVTYPVPAAVQVRLGTPPAGHKFVRVATDILLIAIGTSMVIDAIEDLGRI